MIPTKCEAKIRDLARGPNLEQVFIELFEVIIKESKALDNSSGTVVVPMYDEETGLQPGDFAPELHFVARRVE